MRFECTSNELRMNFECTSNALRMRFDRGWIRTPLGYSQLGYSQWGYSQWGYSQWGYSQLWNKNKSSKNKVLDELGMIWRLVSEGKIPVEFEFAIRFGLALQETRFFDDSRRKMLKIDIFKIWRYGSTQNFVLHSMALSVLNGLGFFLVNFESKVVDFFDKFRKSFFYLFPQH